MMRYVTTTGICNFTSVKDEVEADYDDAGGKLVLHDLLLCREDMADDGMKRPIWI